MMVFFLDIQGTMSLFGINGSVGDLIKRIGEIIGTETMVSTILDFHGYVTKKRKPYYKELYFNYLRLDSRETDIVEVKIEYFVPELYNMRANWNMALTPGGVDQNLGGWVTNTSKDRFAPLIKT